MDNIQVELNFCLIQDSPSSKLLYAKDIPRYRNLVSQFYQRIHDMAPVSDQEMANIMAEHSSVNICFQIFAI